MELKTAAEIRNLIRQTCERCGCPELASKIKYVWNSRFTRRMGDATYDFPNATGVVRFSKPLWGRADLRERKNTIVHEVCHIITFYKYGKSASPHGARWKKMMLLAGEFPERCHNVDTNGLTRKQTKIQVRCGCSQKSVTKNMFTRMKNGSTYSCGTCNKEISFL